LTSQADLIESVAAELDAAAEGQPLEAATFETMTVRQSYTEFVAAQISSKTVATNAEPKEASLCLRVCFLLVRAD